MTDSPIPPGDALFSTFFYAWYDEAARARHPEILKTDIEELELPPGTDLDDLQWMSPEQRDACHGRLESITAAAFQDIARFLDQPPPPNATWLAAADRALDEDEIFRILQTARADDYANPYLVFCCELGAAIAYILRDRHPGLIWLFDEPYWESALYHPPSGTRIPVFHWAIRRMSAPGLEHPLADKVAALLDRLA